MERLQRAAVILSLAEKLWEKGSWCGETHIQKAAYILKEMLEVPLESEFVLYKHGPYSFDLTDDLARFKADGILQEEVMPYPYGPRIRPGKLAEQIRSKFPKTTAKYLPIVQFVADNLGDSKVTVLERLATALYVTREGVAAADVRARARRLNELKPHVPLDEAQEAVERVDRMIGESRRLKAA
ncbi:hypothetical protein [Geobacter argillaceus]|uniref:Antitoxin SocA-like Panacea domain-containing protein n=1 Tax=Geobacter argillaceus TaxID=345631 RepID=A0A562VNA8_9BACT|nr:hypothetical protein [Geobacter argillaceus]TWJ19466.1 hypothetical protein JN12_01583 [Geobacter argillaceus]